MVTQNPITPKTIEQLLIQLHQHGVKLWVENGRLYSQAPKAGIPSALRAEIRRRKVQIIAFLEEAQSATSQTSAGQPAPTIKPAPRDEPIPLSFAQQRLWFLDQLEGEANPTYIIPAAYRLSGLLRIDLLEQALNAIVVRHESLRTTFPAIEGEPVQQIHQLDHSDAFRTGISLTVVELSNLPADTQRQELEQRLLDETVLPFDLATGPLLRATLYALGKSEHVLLLTMHHIISDGWSLTRFMHELDRLYGAFAAGNTSPLPPLPIQYADYTLWQREWLQGERLDAVPRLRGETAYWKQKLHNAPTLLELPTDYPRPSIQRYKGRMERFVIDPQLTAQLRALSRKHEATLFMTLLAGFATLLARYSEHAARELIIGTPIANRNHPDLEPLIGFFINTLALRVNLRETNDQPLSFAALLQQIRQTTLEAFAHQELPFEQVIQEVGVTRHLSHAPLVQVMFALENNQAAQGTLGNLTTEPLSLETQFAKFDLSLFLDESASGLSGTVEYNIDLFTSATIQRMIGHFQTLLAGIVADPQRSITHFPLLTESERHKILVEWNDYATDYPKDKCIHELFEQQVARTPDAVAVVFDESSKSTLVSQLTYAELNERANQLAHHLQSLGVGPETLVGICVERGIRMIVGLLGILKAGGAYVPLDIAYPEERLAFMLEDTSVSILLTEEKLLSKFPQTITMLCLDSAEEMLAAQPVKNLKRAVAADNLAYIMYTSGSTGQPKGVCVSQRNVVRLVQNNSFAQFSAQEVWLQLAPISFDASTLEIWGPLLNGAKLVIMPPGQPTLSELGQAIRQHQITTLWLTAGLFHLMVDEQLEDLRSLRQLLAGGDVLSVTHVQKVLAQLPDCQLINGYGPTENTTFTCCFRIREANQIRTSVPIGPPIANTQVYILNKALQPVPVGVVGELYAGGDGVALGYHNRPELTAERFIPNPFGTGRLYNTGDLVRWLPDGNIEFLGRIDNQVKIRGFRIELGEIEAVLTDHPLVQDAVVVARQDKGKDQNAQGATDKRLVAYLVLASEADHKIWNRSNDFSRSGPGTTEVVTTVHRIREHLQSKLPDYMVPSAMVPLNTLPLTPNGKVDRRALPAPERENFVTLPEEKILTPRTPVEEQLVAIWSEVLAVPQVSPTDNFFDLGGHSLLVIQILARVRSAFQVELPVRTLFEAATVADLAIAIEEAIKESDTAKEVPFVMPPIQPADRNGALPLSFAQQRLWFLEQLEGPSPTYNIPVALRLTGALQVEALQQAINGIVQRHEVLRTSFMAFDREAAGSDAIAIQQIRSTIVLPLTIIDCQHLSYAQTNQKEELHRLLAQAADEPFDLAQAPLLRVNLYRLDENDHLLLVTMHHIISDGWSLDIWWQELDAFYQAALTGTTPALPPLPIQYADFAIWQRQWLSAPDAQDTHLAYWLQQLADTPPLLELPTDHLRPAVQTFNGQTAWFEIAPDVVDGLNHLSRQANTSLFMSLLGGFALLLARYSRQNDIVIGTPIANRQQQEIEPLIGFFVNTLPLRINLSDSATFIELLAHVRQVTLDGYAHQAIPFEQLVGELDIPRSLSYPPLFQVMLAHHKARSDAGLGTLDATPIELDNVTAKFDLTLYIAEEAGSFENSTGIKAAIEYNSDLFEARTIQRMIGHFQQLLRGIVANPTAHINRLPLLTQAEQQQLTAWNHTTQPYTTEQCIHQLIEAQVARTPDAVAVLFDGGTESGQQISLTYAQLNRRANQLAHHLIDLGVARGHFVGLCLPPSDHLVIGMLAILKAGGAYVPLDSGSPTARLAQITSNERIQFVLTEEHLAEGLPDSVKSISLDGETARIDQLDDQNPINRVNATDLIYMIYTSGSTGIPKGAGVYHHSFTNLVEWYVNKFELGKTDRVLITSSPSFDLTQKNFFAPLIVGGQLHLSSAAPYEYPDMRRHIAQHNITWLNCAPSAFYPFVEPFGEINDASALQEVLKQLSSLRYLFLGGEPITLTRLQPWLHAATCRAKVVNTYGPTECTDVVASYTITASDLLTKQDVPIGSPVTNVTLHVLDEHQQPVPVGIPGELCIGGVCVGAGYLDDSQLTAAKFISSPTTKSDQTIYRTGDLVRRRLDGQLVFLGRLDHQVKVRGFRIELGEIETVLRRHPSVQEAVVVTYESEREPTQLVAYVTPTNDQLNDYSDSALRQHLQAELPDYMIPAAFMVLEQFPLTTSGKIDRKRLPNPDDIHFGTDTDLFVAPATPNEERLASIWAEVLKLKRDRIGREHNFFALGGHSLLAVQLVARIRTEFNIELPVRTVFEAPTIAVLSETIEKTTASPLSSIQKQVRQPEYTDMPLSFAQQRLWFLNRMDNSGATYNIPTAFHLTGTLQVAPLQQALAKIIQRHEVFRTTFPTVNGTPVQRIHAARTIPLIEVDLRAFDQAAQQRKLMQLLVEEANYAFDFERCPLLRVTLYHLQPNQSALMVNMHHIISDDWSVDVWWREFNALYQAFVSGNLSPLPQLSLQYADFAQWQREQLTGELLDNQLTYWKGQLADAPSLLNLPTDRPRPTTQTFNGAWEAFELDPDLATALFECCRDSDVTPFMFLNATFAILLARYSGQEDVIIGTPITNRKQIEIEPLIGFFVNTLALRTDLSGNPTFDALLNNMRDTVLDAFSQADIPFERLVSELNVPRNLNHSPLFQVLFVWQQTLTSTAALGDLTMTPLTLDHTTAKFDLTLYLGEHHREPSGRTGIAGAFEYNTDLFDRTTIRRMIGHLQTLLSGIVANPTQSIWQLPLLSANEQAQLLEEWNGTQSGQVNQCLHHLFEAQAERTPNAIAVEFAPTPSPSPNTRGGEQRTRRSGVPSPSIGGRILPSPSIGGGAGGGGRFSALTYRELNQRANQLARHLQTLGVGPDAIVGICLERSIEMTIGILAILKAGGAYLPIDPTYPAERIAFMLTDAKVSLLLTQQSLVAQLPETGSQLLCLESIQPTVAQQSTENLDVEISEENLLYLLYTSGSTGQPKGVMMPHRPLTNLIQWQLTEKPFHIAKEKPTRTLQFTPISFDVSCQELFTTWSEGGTLVLVEESLRRDPYALLRYLADQKIDRLFLPFVALQQLAEAAIKRPDLIFALRDVITAGEQLQSTSAITTWFRRMNATLHNHYGPTETHVITAYTLPEDVNNWSLLPPIGRPIANCQTYILDKHQRPVPIGVAGELYLGGLGVARGYLNRPALTEERFVRLRWIGIPNLWNSGQLYRPGDLARYRADGQIEYLGRVDNQVKIRGYRIEPGEIEAVLAQHIAVQEAVVMAPQDQTGQRQLVAVAVLDKAHHPANTQAQLHHYLRQKLPAYMVPARLLCVDKLPLTPSGKIDRRKLLDTPQIQPTLDENFVSPQSTLEKQIANIWQELLQLERVGVHDNFFDLGGHSLLVVQLFDQLQKITDANLTITQLFQYTTITSLANHLSQAQPTTQSYDKNKARANTRRAALRRRRKK